MSRNQLDRETSPYLLQHKDNPVHWHAWGPEALERARREDKPVLLSVGYAACHWCHVMAHESFEDDETAAVMNELFVNIKVDREERPDIDAIYQAALALLGQHGGWPLTMFLDSDGEPFWGGTYFPPDARYGRPAFRDVLRRIHEVYHDDRAAVSQNRSAIKEALGKLSRPPEAGAPVPVSLAVLDQVAEQLSGQIDRQFGGVAGAPKFPHVPVLELLWRAYLRSGREDYREAVTISLDRMSQGGIYDHLGGGYARYATDHYWLVPHFEKMLYDNAQLLDILCTAWQHERKPLYEARIRETVAWVLREMVAEGGAFAATLDADSEGVEGKYYVWQESEIDALLGADAATFKAAYNVTPGGNWEGATILNRSARPELGDDAQEAELARLREILWQAREQRVRPGWDDKVLADWNGLMIAALANAGATFGEGDWIAAAERAFNFIGEAMNEGGRLRHAYRRGEARHVALLDDYATMCDAAVMLYQVTGARRYLDQAEAWLEVVERHYRDDVHGGYFLTADDAEALITRTRTAQDNAVPAGNAILVRVFARLYHLTGDDGYHRRARAVIDAFAPELGRNVFGLLTLLNGFELLEAAVQIVIVGRRGDEEVQALLAAAHQASLPDKVVLVVTPEETLPESHPAHGKGQLEGRATAYVCIGTTCSLPVTTPDAFAELLRRPAPAPSGAP